MRTFVDTYGIAVGPEEIHRVAEDINEILQDRGWEVMRHFDNGARGGPYYKHLLEQDPNLEFSYNFVDWPGDSWEEEDFKDLTILLDVMSSEPAILESMESALLGIDFVKIRQESFVQGDSDSREIHFELSRHTASH